MCEHEPTCATIEAHNARVDWDELAMEAYLEQYREGKNN